MKKLVKHPTWDAEQPIQELIKGFRLMENPNELSNYNSLGWNYSSNSEQSHLVQVGLNTSLVYLCDLFTYNKIDKLSSGQY